MASRSLDKLKPIFREKIEALLEEAPFDILVYCTVRSAWEQAILYRQSRSRKVIDEKILTLEKYGHESLARILRDVGPRSGPHVTKAAPGESWHQYCEAVDLVPIIGGKPAWDVKKNKESWSTIGTIAVKHGLNWGGNWIKWADYPHIQYPQSGNPLKLGVTGCILLETDL